MATKKTEKRSFDFSLLQQKESDFFPFYDIATGDKLDSGAILLSADSEEFDRAHHLCIKEFSDSKKGKNNLQEHQFEKFEMLEKVVACTVELVNCRIGEKEYATNRDDIREFFTLLPRMRKQMWEVLTHHKNFLQIAERAGSAT